MREVEDVASRGEAGEVDHEESIGFSQDLPDDHWMWHHLGWMERAALGWTWEGPACEDWRLRNAVHDLFLQEPIRYSRALRYDLLLQNLGGRVWSAASSRLYVVGGAGWLESGRERAGGIALGNCIHSNISREKDNERLSSTLHKDQVLEQDMM